MFATRRAWIRCAGGSLILACDRSTTSPELDGGWRLVVLGVAQDAGVPQANCRSPNCLAAIEHPSRRHFAASAAILAPDGRAWLLDATPDIREQLVLLRAEQESRGHHPEPRRPVEGVFLTHGHMGHYLGLAHFGFEAAHTKGIEAYASSSMLELLGGGAPWSQLLQLENLVPREVNSGERVSLGGLEVEAVRVPHRGEFTDTLAYLLHGPRQRVLYIPDCNPWSRWEPDAITLLKRCDLALVDGTFFDGDELPGRDLEQIGHPTIADTLLRFVRTGIGPQFVFFHLNHSNPALDPKSEARAEIKAAGARLARRGELIEL